MNSYALVCTLALAVLTQARAEAPAAARYSDMAACETVLIGLRRRVPEVIGGERAGPVDIEAYRTPPILDRLIALAPEDSKLGEILKAIARRPFWRTDTSFAVTQVYEGREAVAAYLRRGEERAARLEAAAYHDVEGRLFNARTVRRELPPLASLIGGLTTSVALSIATPFLLQPHFQLTTADLVEVSAAVGMFGGLLTSYVWGLRGEWAARILLAYRTPARRRALVDRIWRAEPSAFFAQLKKKVDATNPSSSLSSATFTYEVPRPMLTRWLALPFDRLEGATVETLAGRRDPRLPASVLPARDPVDADDRRASVLIHHVVFVDPETGDVGLIVHARGRLRPAVARLGF